MLPSIPGKYVNSHWPHLIARSGPTPGLLPPPWGREKARRFAGTRLPDSGVQTSTELVVTCNGFAPPVSHTEPVPFKRDP